MSLPQAVAPYENPDRLMREELATAGTLDLAMLSVATAELRTLV